MKKDRNESRVNNFFPLSASRQQIEYLTNSNYTISSQFGHDYRRTVDLLAYDQLSGNILLREKTSCDGHDYVKLVVLSKDGFTEKFKGQNFSANPTYLRA